jgi:heme-degrading monooxygenase HmoA
MNRSRALYLSVLVTLIATGGNADCWGQAIPAASAKPAVTTETRMQAPLTIDLHAHPNLQFRIDAFTVPATSRPEFEAAMQRNLAFIATLHGFTNHIVFEKTSGPTTFDIVTIQVWGSPEALAAASEKARAYYKSTGFDMPAMLARLGITASIGYYRAPIELQ